jgi:hypothetical protein
MMIAGGVAALVIIGALASEEMTGPEPGPGPTPIPQPDPRPGPTPTPNPNPDPPVRQQANHSGSWRLEGGSSFAISHDDGYISGTGVTRGWGQVVLEGPINGPISVESMMTGETVGELSGRIIDGGQPGLKDWSGTLIDHSAGGARYPILFHINH